MTSLCRSRSFSKRVASRWTELTVRPVSAPVNAQNQNSQRVERSRNPSPHVDFLLRLFTYGMKIFDVRVQKAHLHLAQLQLTDSKSAELSLLNLIYLGRAAATALKLLQRFDTLDKNLERID